MQGTGPETWDMYVKSDLPSRLHESYDYKSQLNEHNPILFLLPDFLGCPIDFKAQKYLKLNLRFFTYQHKATYICLKI